MLTTNMQDGIFIKVVIVVKRLATIFHMTNT